MVSAQQVITVRPDLAIWQAYEPSVKVDLTSTARRISAGWVLVDPIPLAEAAEAELFSGSPPVAIVLTSGNHARAAESFRARLEVPIFAHPAAIPELGFDVDQELADSQTILGELTVLTLPGAAPGEVAIYGAGLLHLGDAVIHLPSFGFGLLPDKYCDDPVELRRSLEKLLRFPFEVLTFAHGLPLVAQARQRLSLLLA